MLFKPSVFPPEKSDKRWLFGIPGKIQAKILVDVTAGTTTQFR
jgi:hypothetical protein